MVDIERRLPENANLRNRVDELLERGTSYMIPMRDGVRIHTDIRGAYKAFHPDVTDVFYFHGSPSFGGATMPRGIAFTNRNMRMFSPTRRGYFVSPDKHNRSFEDSANDAADVAEHFGVNSCLVVSKSGGIGHALKFAQQYPDLVKGVAIVAGALSPHMMGQDWAEGMAQANAVIRTMGDEEIYEYIGEQARSVLHENTNFAANRFLQSIPPKLSDLARRDIGDNLFEWDFQDAYDMALLRGHNGWYNDAQSNYHDWGFDVHEVRQPVLLYYYEQDDYAPKQHGERLHELLPNSRLIVSSGSHFRSLSDIFNIIYDLEQL